MIPHCFRLKSRRWILVSSAIKGDFFFAQKPYGWGILKEGSNYFFARTSVQRPFPSPMRWPCISVSRLLSVPENPFQCSAPMLSARPAAGLMIHESGISS